MVLTKVFVQGFGELVQCWWDLQALPKDPLLSLDANNLWPLHKSVKISLWRQSTTYTKLL